MKLISHRGNINGPNKEQENHPDYITSALKQGYDVEVDVWLIDGNIVLGHDEPQYDLGPPQSEMLFNFLAPQSHKLWLHFKNLEALGELFKYRDLNVFWHNTDAVVLTSKNFIWTFPNKPLLPNSICVLPELGVNGNLNKCYGLCSDFPVEYKNAVYR